MIARERTIRERTVQGSGRRGVVSVELALLLPTFIMLLFGTLEIGLLAKQSQSLNHVARETARVATTGAPVSRIQSRMADVAPAIDAQRITATIEYRAWDSHTGAWGGWMTLADDGETNIAQTGDQIRIALEYSHQLATGGLMGAVLNASEDHTVAINATIVTMRE